MGIHVTRYKTENGKTRKAKGGAAASLPAKPASKEGAPESNSGAAGGAAAGNKNQQPGNPAKQGAQA